MADRSPALFADVAVRAALFHHPHAVFTYHVPHELRSSVAEGTLVWVPLGRQRVQGIVVALYTPDQASVQPRAAQNDHGTLAPHIRPIADLVNAEITIPPHLLRLARWVHEYYRAPLWDALELLLPPGVAQEAQTTWRTTAQGLAVELGALPQGERGVLYYLRRNGETSEKTLHEALHGSPSELRRLCLALKERGLVARGTLLSKPKARPRHERLVRMLVDPQALPLKLHEFERAPRQAEALQTIAARTSALLEADAAPLVTTQGLPLTILRQLEAKHAITITSREVVRNPLDGAAIQPDVPPELSPLQARVLAPIADAVMQQRHAVFFAARSDGQR